MGAIAYLFPGQGSQVVGMGRALLAESRAARLVFEEADEALGARLSELILEGPDEELRRTAVTQPAILTMSIAALRALEERGSPPPDFVAGHSLGEYAALVAARCISFADAVRAVRERGRFMQEAVPEGQGAMAAVLLMEAEDVQRIIDHVVATHSEAYVAVANFNGPTQTVIAGSRRGVDLALVALKDAGAKRVIELPVSAPFHCGLMAPVKPRLEDVLAGVRIGPIEVPVVTNVEATSNQDPARVCPLLVEQVTAPVRFTEMAAFLLAQGVDRFVEVGPGKALSGMLKRMAKDAKFMNVEDPASLDATLCALGA
ncbi:MAG: ACP S-malonyltransferase [Myxococcota bacterium]